MATRARTAHDFGDLPMQSSERSADRALSPAAGIMLAALVGGLCWVALFALIL